MASRVRKLAVLSASIFLAFGAAAAAEESGAERWRFELAPYLWLPGVEGRLKYKLPPGSGDPEFAVSGPDVLDLLNFAFLINGTARKGRFSINSDFVYLNLGKDTEGELISISPDGPLPGSPFPIDASLNLSTASELDGLQWSLSFGYAFWESEDGRLEPYVGARYFKVEPVTNWELTASIDLPGQIEPFPRSGSVGAKTELWDAILGVRGYRSLGDSRWAVPFAMDVGTGSSELSWNAVVGLMYEFGWGDLGVAYRHLAYDQDDDKLMQSFSFSGPALVARLSF